LHHNKLFVGATIWALLLNVSAQTNPSPAPSAQQPASTPSTQFALEDGTPVKLRIGRTVSSADAHVGDNVDLEVLEEVKVGNVVVVPKGGTAMATVTSAQSKRRMGRGGNLDINIDYVKLVDGEKAALRAIKDGKGGGHVGAMTGAMVATSLVFFPAAPLFLFMHGKDITIPKGTEVTAYVNGNQPLELAKFQSQPYAAGQVAGASAEVNVTSTPTGAELYLDGNFVGNTPSTISVPGGEHVITVKNAGYKSWERKIRTYGGKVNITATMEAGSDSAANHETGVQPIVDSGPSLGDAARALRQSKQQ
jgi:hypothetical protein